MSTDKNERPSKSPQAFISIYLVGKTWAQVYKHGGAARFSSYLARNFLTSLFSHPLIYCHVISPRQTPRTPRTLQTPIVSIRSIYPNACRVPC